ncbi:MAG: hypothetical protein MUF58_22610 [Arcicella sp.]|jgi:hypothetical protein|nr:hypothetical protein [Arcicella sp.]
MKRNWLQYIILFVFVNILLGVILNKIFDSVTPSVLNEAVEYFSTDNTVLKKIGGYRTFKYNFDSNDYDAYKPTKFELQIFGYERGVKMTGIMEYKNSRWLITKADTLYREFE